MTADANLDLVYILKPTDNNLELRYSLRSIEKFCTFRRVWFVGYQPKWTQGVGFVATEQNGSKYKNSTLNVVTACQCADISSEFVLMNDDFYAVRKVDGWHQTCNVCRGTIDAAIEQYKAERRPSNWMQGFAYTKALLTLLGSKNFYNFEVHMPLIINKQRFLSMLEHPLIEWFRQTDNVLMKRSLYQNLYCDTEPRVIEDVKLKKGEDLTWSRLESGWLSVFDGVISNAEYPLINQYLKTEFPDKSRFEV